MYHLELNKAHKDGPFHFCTLGYRPSHSFVPFFSESVENLSECDFEKLNVYFKRHIQWH